MEWRDLKANHKLAFWRKVHGFSIASKWDTTWFDIVPDYSALRALRVSASKKDTTWSDIVLDYSAHRALHLSASIWDTTWFDIVPDYSALRALHVSASKYDTTWFDIVLDYSAFRALHVSASKWGTTEGDFSVTPRRVESSRVSVKERTVSAKKPAVTILISFHFIFFCVCVSCSFVTYRL